MFDFLVDLFSCRGLAAWINEGKELDSFYFCHDQVFEE